MVRVEQWRPAGYCGKRGFRVVDNHRPEHAPPAEPCRQTTGRHCAALWGLALRSVEDRRDSSSRRPGAMRRVEDIQGSFGLRALPAIFSSYTAGKQWANASIAATRFRLHHLSVVLQDVGHALPRQHLAPTGSRSRVAGRRRALNRSRCNAPCLIPLRSTANGAAPADLAL